MEKCCDLDLDQTMPNVELIQDIFIYYNVFKFQVLDQLSQTQRHTTISTLVAVDKPQL